jgi:broad specificity phosphatase PhoE
MLPHTILLVRHGETEWNRISRYQGWSDSPLTNRGMAQAQAIGRMLSTLADIASAELVTSPIGRARHTAQITQASLGCIAPLQFDDRLREISLGSWDGLHRAEIVARAPGIFDGDGHYEWYFRTPDGETYEGFRARVGDWLASVRDRSVIAVTHGIVTRVSRGLYAGLPLAAALKLPVPPSFRWPKPKYVDSQHAAPSFSPKAEHLNAALDVMEGVVAALPVHDQNVKKLEIPERPPRRPHTQKWSRRRRPIWGSFPDVEADPVCAHRAGSTRILIWRRL